MHYGIADFWDWHFERRGLFSVRSAYRVLTETKTRRENWLDGVPGPSSSAQTDKAWTNLWKLSVPSKPKVFVWRLANQSIPSADLLQHRNMATSSNCALCGCMDSWKHSLIDCTMSRCTWALSDSNLTEHMIGCMEPNAKNWLFFLHDTVSHAEFTRMIIMLD